jgi:hypothetical protein
MHLATEEPKKLSPRWSIYFLMLFWGLSPGKPCAPRVILEVPPGSREPVKA